MTFAELSAAGKDASRPFDETSHNEGRVETTGAHHSDGSQVRWILISGYTRRISRCITAPVAEESKYFGVKFFLAHYLTPPLNPSGQRPLSEN